MPKVEIFDPAMCCPTGICGVNVDPVLVQFAADVAWLKTKGITVDRYNLSQQPEKFVECAAVKQSMALAGELCLPLILVDGSIVFQNKYPSRGQLAETLGLVVE